MLHLDFVVCNFMHMNHYELENVDIANALQLEAARRRAVLICFNFVACAKFELAQPIRDLDP